MAKVKIERMTGKPSVTGPIGNLVIIQRDIFYVEEMNLHVVFTTETSKNTMREFIAYYINRKLEDSTEIDVGSNHQKIVEEIVLTAIALEDDDCQTVYTEKTMVVKGN